LWKEPIVPTLRLVGLDSREERPDVLPFPKGLGGTGSNAERVIAAVEEALQQAKDDIDELNALIGPFRLPEPEDDSWPPSAA
jgi:hypothetical protein